MPPVPKSRTNSQQGFKFRGIDDALDVLSPLLAEHQVFFLPTVLERIVEDRTTGKGATLHTVHLHVAYRFYGSDGDSLTCDVWGEGADSGDKATSKAMTMALKSALFQTFTISGEEDPDATSVGESKPAKSRTSKPAKPAAVPTHEEAARLEVRALLSEKFAGDVDQIKGFVTERFGEGATTATISDEQVSRLLEELTEKQAS